MTDNVTPLHQPALVTEPAPSRNAIKQRRYRKRKKAVTASVTPRVTVTRPKIENIDPVDKTEKPANVGGFVDLAAYGAAVALAGAAAWFSIRGMVVLFPGSPLSVVGMATAMEIAKLVTAGWLARRWGQTAPICRILLCSFITGLAVINGAGVFSQLVAAHVGERGHAGYVLETQIGAVDAKIAMHGDIAADLDRRINQIDNAIEESTRRGKTKAALSAMDSQRKARTGLLEERNQAAATLADLKTERVQVAAQGRQQDLEAAPIRYVAELFGAANQDSERAIRWLIVLMVLCCDPLAIALTAAASARR